jgi:IS1 family transposase
MLGRFYGSNSFRADGVEIVGQMKHLSVSAFATDCWKSYEEFIPPEQHCQTKTEPPTVASQKNDRNITKPAQDETK